MPSPWVTRAMREADDVRRPTRVTPVDHTLGDRVAADPPPEWDATTLYCSHGRHEDCDGRIGLSGRDDRDPCMCRCHVELLR